MNTTARTLVLAVAAFGATLAASTPTLAQEIKREEMVSYFQMPQIDKNKDGMVAKKEFMDMMAKAWDEHMSAMPKGEMKAKDKMTLQQYQEFAKMFGLSIGG